MGILSRLFGGSQPTPEERSQIIAYLVAEWRLRARQDDAAGEYNDTLTRLGGSLAPGNEAAATVAQVARHMASVNRELVDGHGDLGPVPDAAGRCYFAWHKTYLALADWASAAAVAYEAIAASSHPDAGRVQTLLREEESSRRGAEKEEGRLMRHIRLRAEEGRQIMKESEAGNDGSATQF